MNEFDPPRRRGIIFHAAALVLLLGCGVGLLFLATQERAGSFFVLFLLVALALLGFSPFVAYRGYALLTAGYTIERDGLRLHWGLRREDIPLPEIEWIRPADEIGFELPLPWLAWPGALLGTRQVANLGQIEFLASELDGLVLVATPQKIYALSPTDARGFIRAYQHINELGSLNPLPQHSVEPAMFLRQVWEDRLARSLILSGIGLTLLLLVVTSLLIPGRGLVAIGFTPAGLPQEPVSADRLLLLPTLSVLSFVFDFVVGLFLYRTPAQRYAAYMIWLSSALCAAILLIAIIFFI